MGNPRRKFLITAVLSLVTIWLVAMAGLLVVRAKKVTSERIAAFMEATDLSKLSGDERARALQRLTEMLNKLSIEERRQMRMGGAFGDWFAQMTEEEKGAFIESTMPTGFKQMIAAFEELPEEARRRTVDQALKRLKEQPRDNSRNPNGTNAPALSPELEAKVRTIGLKTFYGESSAQTKAELAPLLEEMQKSMESGRAFRRR